MVISSFREILVKGTIGGFDLLHAKPLLIMVLPAGGFLSVGILMALFNWVNATYLHKTA
jgi:electron transport complex protein RnfE